jgi:sialate O-acetylesterase
MIYPIRHLSIRGFIWYQGESNRSDGMMYARLCTAMLKGWRHDFDQGKLPFYFVQLPPYNWGKHDSTAYEYALLREAQASMLKIKNTGMAVTMDSKEFDNLHPRDKKPVGIRLAKIALHKTYHLEDVQYRGPVFKNYKTTQDTIKISFEEASIGTGLITSDGRSPQYFFVAGSDKVFHEAQARIKGNQIWIYSPAVHHPVAVRYAFTNYPVTNFENKEGLPAWPFRTDHWNQ